jgi:hypothetical protein
MKRISDAWRSCKPAMLEALSLRESRPTNAEKERYGLEDDCYIIRRITSA